MLDITSNSEEGFCDIVLSISTIKEKDDCFICLCEGSYEKISLGIEVIIKKGMKPGIIDGDFDNSAFLQDGIIVKSAGESSDNFVNLVGKYYGFDINKKFTDKNINFLSFAMSENSFNLKDDYIKFKVFFDLEDELGLYSEMFCNVNLKEGIIEFNEKDEDYRENIIKSFIY